MRLATYTLPIYWASYLVNDDPSGLEDREIAQVDSFIDSIKDPCAFCVDVSEESYFSHHNDANDMGGDVTEFTFDLGNKEN